MFHHFPRGSNPEQRNKKTPLGPIAKGMGVLVLAAALLISPLMPASALGEDLSGGMGLAAVWISSESTLAPGVVYNRIAGTNSEGGPQKAHLVTITPGNQVIPRVIYGTELMGRSRLTAQIAKLEAEGQMIPVGINGDYYSLSTGIPLGTVINDGKIKVSDAGMNAVGFLSDGSTIIGKPEMSITLRKNMLLSPVRLAEPPTTIPGPPITLPEPPPLEVQSESDAGGTAAETIGETAIEPIYDYGPFEFTVDHINKTQTVYGVYLYTSDFSTSTRTSVASTEVVLSAQEAFTVGGTISATVESVGDEAMNTPLAPGKIVLSASGVEPKMRLAKLLPGDVVDIAVSTPDPLWANVREGIGAGELLIENGMAQTGFNQERHPRTALGLRGDGSVVLFQVDGRQPAFSAGMTLAELADYMLARGCVKAVNLDGGGSSTTVIRYPATDAAVLANSPAGGSERQNANGIVLQNNNARTWVAAHLHFEPRVLHVHTGASVPLSVVATDSAYYAAEMPEEPVFIPYGGKEGTIAGNLFTAGPESGDAYIQATSGAAAGIGKVIIVDSIDSFALNYESISALPGESYTIVPTATVDGYPVNVNATSFMYSVTDEVGTISESGVYTPAEAVGKTGAVTVSYHGASQTLTREIPIRLGKQPEVLDGFDAGISPYSVLPSPSATAQLSAEAQAYIGQGSLRLVYGFDPSCPEMGSIDIVPVVPFTSADKKRNADLWVAGDCAGQILSAVFTGADGSQQTADFTGADGTAGIVFDGWQQMTARIPEELSHPVSLTALRLRQNPTAVSNSGTLLLDQLRMGYGGEYDDREAPTIRFDSPGGIQVTNLTEEVMISAEVDDGFFGSGVEADSVLVSVNGAPVNHTMDTNGKVTASSGVLQMGLNKISIRARDRYFNEGAAATGIMVLPAEPGAQLPALYSDVAGHWSENYIRYVSDREIMQGEKTDQGRIFSPDRTLTRAEFAVLLARFRGADPDLYESVSVPFADVDQMAKWYKNAAKYCFESGLISGVAQLDGSVTFSGQKEISRAEVITILGKLLRKGRPVQLSASFSDAGSIPDWAVPYVGTVVANGLIGGYPDGTLQPAGIVKRGEIAKILFSMP